MGYSSRDWTAWRNRMPGGDGASLLVSAQCDCDDLGWEFSLTVVNQGTPGNPEELQMRFDAKGPSIGSPALNVVPVGYGPEPIADSYLRVRIHGGDADGKVIPIEDASRDT